MVKKHIVEKLTHPAIARLLYKAGIRDIASTTYPEIEGMTVIALENLLKPALLYMESGGRTTVSSGDVEMAIERLGMKFYGGEEDLKKCPIFMPSKTNERAKPGEKAIKAIRFYQQQSGCYYLPKKMFIELVKYIAGDLKSKNRFTKEALNMLQSFVEAKIVDIAEDAQLAAVHAGRIKVTPKDFQFVIKISMSPLFISI